MRLEGKNFFITGGASGLGEATARLFVSKGANVTIADFNEKRGQEVAASLGGNAVFVKCDVTKESTIKAALEESVATFGSVWGCINCAGTGPPRRVLSKSGRVHPMKHFKKVIDINLSGTFNVLSLAAKAMSANEPNESGERGVIINVASVAAYDGQIGQAAYAASKAGVCGMTLPIARDLGRWGMRICTIAPGLFLTPMMKALPEPARQSLGKQVIFPSRLGDPSEFAALCQFITESTYMNGECIRLDGAIRMGPK